MKQLKTIFGITYGETLDVSPILMKYLFKGVDWVKNFNRIRDEILLVLVSPSSSILACSHNIVLYLQKKIFSYSSICRLKLICFWDRPI